MAAAAAQINIEDNDIVKFDSELSKNTKNTNVTDYVVLGKENNSSSFYNIKSFPDIPIQLKGMETKIGKKNDIFKDIFSEVNKATFKKIETYLQTQLNGKTIRNIIKEKISTKPMRILQEIIDKLEYDKDATNKIICRKIKLVSDSESQIFNAEHTHSGTITDQDVGLGIPIPINCKIFVGVLELIRKKSPVKNFFCDHMNSFIVDLDYKKIFVFEPKGNTKQPQLNKLSEKDIKDKLSSGLSNKDYFKDFAFIKNSQSFLSCPQGICRDTDCQTYSLYGNLLYILNRDNIPKNKSDAEKYINDILFSSTFMNTNKINLLLILVADLFCKNRDLADEVQWLISDTQGVCKTPTSNGGGKTNKSKKTNKTKKSKKTK